MNRGPKIVHDCNGVVIEQIVSKNGQVSYVATDTWCNRSTLAYADRWAALKALNRDDAYDVPQRQVKA